MGYSATSRAVESFIKNRMRREAAPIPLKSTSYDIELAAGLAVVKLVRTFRNDEQGPIEATITFPVPFDAVVTRIEAKVGDQMLVSRVKAKAAARETYEDAIDRGKRTVLHEELLRGLHMLSVGNVAPGVEIEVTATFVAPLSLAGGAAQLRIPATVGQIYGELPLAHSDALVTGGPVATAVLTVRSRDGTVLVGGQSVVDGPITVKLDRPIELKVVGEPSIFSGTLIGRAADGRQVSLGFVPAAEGEAILDADLLLDVSGSMDDPVAAGSFFSQWDAVKKGLAAASSTHLNERDRINVWVFSNDCRKVGSVSGTGLAEMAPNIPSDSGGTELPRAVETVAASRKNTNVLLVTDGQSGNTIDVQGAVATGARFTVVLVGAGALETNVGYLAALTGGQMFVAQKADTERAVIAAIGSMRKVASPAQPIDASFVNVTRRIAGTEIEAKWTKAVKNSPTREGLAAAVGSYAASLAVLGMKGDEATRLAEAEGIVGHLTSLVLVDEAADAVGEIPATRKIELPDAVTAGRWMMEPARSSPVASFGRRADAGSAFYDAAMQSFARPKAMAAPRNAPAAPPMAAETDELGGTDAFRFIAGRVEWDVGTHALISGNPDGLDHSVKKLLARMSMLDEVQALAKSLGISPMKVAIALLAKADEKSSRTAERIARSIFKKADGVLLETALISVGLDARNI